MKQRYVVEISIFTNYLGDLIGRATTNRTKTDRNTMVRDSMRVEECAAWSEYYTTETEAPYNEINALLVAEQGARRRHSYRKDRNPAVAVAVAVAVGLLTAAQALLKKVLEEGQPEECRR